MKKGLIALSLGTFALGVAEFVMMGILSKLAQDLGVTVDKCGHLISAYASGVCFGAIGLLFLRRMKLRSLMMLLAGIIALGNLGVALAPNFWSMFVARFVAGLPHGAYFGVGAIVARRLVTPEKRVQAVSIVIAGMSVATVCGVPLGTFLTNNFSWRFPFAIVTIMGLATLIAIKTYVPDVGKLNKVSFTGQFHFLKTLPPWLIFGGVLLSQIGLYSWYSYIDPLLLHVSHFSIDDLSWLMIVGGSGMFVGNLVAGRLGVYFKPSAVAFGVMVLGIPVLLGFFFGAQFQWLAVVLLFLGTGVLFGSGSPLQSSIVGYSKGGEMLGAACIQIAYNGGNAIAALFGGMIISAHDDYRLLPLVGVPFLAAGCALILILYFRNERNKLITD